MARVKTSHTGTDDAALRTLTARFQTWMHLPDLAPLYAVLGVAVAHREHFPPLYLMLTGPPSSGKSELVMSLSDVPGVVKSSRITVPALLSGTPKRDAVKSATGGIMRQIGASGILALKDFTSVLSEPVESMKDVMGALREIADGSWSRPFGSDGGRVEDWKGKMSLITACTPVIDQHHQAMSSLGERFILLRYPETDGMHEAGKAVLNDNMDEMREALSSAMKRFLAREFSPVRMNASQSTRVVSMAVLAAKCRSSVPRHAFTRDVEDTPSAEYPARLTKALMALWCGMRSAGVNESRAWKIIGRVAQDSMPRARSLTFNWLAGQNGSGSDNQLTRLSEYIRCSKSATRRVLEDLALHGVLESSRNGVKDVFKVSSWAMERWREAYF